MTTQRFALEPDGPLRLQLTWRPGAQAYEVALDGKPVGEAPAAQLGEGLALQLPDGKALTLRSVTGLGEALQLTYEGRPLREPTNWPPLVKNAGMVLLGIGLLEVLVGAASLGGASVAQQAPSWVVGTLGALGGGAGALVLGLAYLTCCALAFQVRAAPMWAAGALMLVDTALTVGSAVQAGEPFIGGLLARLVVLAAMVRGLQAVRGLAHAARVPAAQRS